MIYFIVIFTAGLLVTISLTTTSHIRKRNVRRIVRRMSKKAIFNPPPPAHVHAIARSPREAAAALHRTRTLLRSAERYMHKREYDRAEKDLIQAIANAPQEQDTYILLAECYLALSRQTKAEAILRSYIDISAQFQSPQSARAIYKTRNIALLRLLADCYEDAGDEERAQALLERITKPSPQDTKKKSSSAPKPLKKTAPMSSFVRR